MQTTKLISTVSYNTPEYLSGRLRTLVEQGIIEYAHWIFHTPEDDEKKTHAHVILQPNKRLDTSALRNQFTELVAGEDKPRCVLPFKPSKMRDWILYAVHDTIYLTSKSQTRKFTYKKTDLHTTEPDLLEDDWRDAHEGENTRMRLVIELSERGVDWMDILKSGLIPVNQLFQYRKIWECFFMRKTDRNGRGVHDEMPASE